MNTLQQAENWLKLSVVFLSFGIGLIFGIIWKYNLEVPTFHALAATILTLPTLLLFIRYRIRQYANRP